MARDPYTGKMTSDLYQVEDFDGSFDREYSLELGSLTQGLSEAESAQEGLNNLLEEMGRSVESYFDGLPDYVRVQLGPSLSLDDAILQLEMVKSAIEEAFDALRQVDADVQEVKKAVRGADAEIESAVDQWPNDRDYYYEVDDPAAREMDRFVKTGKRWS